MRLVHSIEQGLVEFAATDNTGDIIEEEIADKLDKEEAFLNAEAEAPEELPPKSLSCLLLAPFAI